MHVSDIEIFKNFSSYQLSYVCSYVFSVFYFIVAKNIYWSVQISTHPVKAIVIKSIPLQPTP
jgi:hypothetical protein